MVRAIRVVFVLALVLSAAALSSAQSQSVNGTIEGTVSDESGGALPGVNVTVANLDTGDTRVVVTGDSGTYRAPLLPLGRYRVSAELQGFKKFEQQGLTLSAGQSAIINVTLSVGNLSETVTVTQRSADRRARQDRPRPDHRGDRDPQPAAGLAQSLQLRVPPGQRHRLREQRVRRAAHQRQRLADAHQLPDRRQHQHREGSRRPPHAADLRSAGPRGQGHHQRLRPGVRPDDRDGLQRHHPVRAPTACTGRRSFRFKRNSMSSRPFFLSPTARKPDTEANDVDRDPGRAGRARTSGTSSAPTSTWIAA